MGVGNVQSWNRTSLLLKSTIIYKTTLNSYYYLLFLLNRQLAEVRKSGKDTKSGAVVEAEKKLIICSVKKPLKLSESQVGQSRVRRNTSSLKIRD